MVTPDALKSQLDSLVSHLVEIGLSSDQNFAIRRQLVDGRSEITFSGAEHLALALKDTHYHELYDALRTERAFNVLLPDGAMLQMSYLFSGENLERHRLAFLPSPHLSEFQNNPELYLEDVIFADIVAKSVVPFPVRFDFDSREGVYRNLHHPKSHLTLGQYKNCRIPATSALTPFHFVDFVLRHFYHTAYLDYASSLPQFHETFSVTASDAEQKIVHIAIPKHRFI
ncbi:DUF2290 domain-containing protein [Robbsia andropogonis]|uniref:DUF2290 domain-containing protein n=1 Tax=Robbsia andropogonis TaxID=28092 RepID=UPI0009E3B984|nr:DUF2290 domain-containing protein [Robbsia andropogonis]